MMTLRVGVTSAALYFAAASSLAAQVPNAAAAIGAAKDARAKTEAAQQKNSDALNPPASSGQAAQAGQAGQAPQVKPAAPAPPPAQTPAPPPAQPPAPPSAPTGTPGQAPGQSGATAAQQPESSGPGYSYDPAGRRDPFVSLLGRGGDLPATGARPTGLPGALINDVTLKGVLKSAKGDFTALLQSPDNHTYIVHAGDKLMDGSVRAITQDAIVFSQDVNDPLSLVKQREVRKTIRPEAR